METLGNVFLTTLWIALLFAWLIVLFNILGDLFRDSELSGWWKAIWVLLLVFFPFITALVYLIARGKGMRERSMQTMQEMRSAQDDYIRQVAGTDPSDQIAKAQGLLDSGAISPEEFQTLKAKALA